MVKNNVYKVHKIATMASWILQMWTTNYTNVSNPTAAAAVTTEAEPTPEDFKS